MKLLTTRRLHRSVQMFSSPITTMNDAAIEAALRFYVGTSHSDKDSVVYYQYPNTDGGMQLHRDQLPEKASSHMRVVLVSDTHTRHRCLGRMPECDLFVHCGDILMTGRKFSINYQRAMLEDFDEWLGTIPATQRIVVAGNHDYILGTLSPTDRRKLFSNARYMENEGMDLQGVKIWASPISQGASKNQAFQSEEFAQETLQLAPSAADIMITHSHFRPLRLKMKYKMHLYGHTHWRYGVFVESIRDDSLPPEHQKAKRISVCAPICDGAYQLTQFPIVVDYPLPV